MTTTLQPQAVQMSMANLPTRSQTQECQHKANRLRGGGAAKDCFLSAVGCFICFEGCKDCCECFADIVCCPCEMCC
ncbi:uncharacterized protein LAESUDRAFT_719894 [Laetiporus sulphureus 93-53]|uniref:Uncharacterized protein n=1 Tax=Laetiporus sulphureus 93-53 TaxID=1314785 RepID=A0A165HMZ2_9APHY|nr:uncharacterized protein LAESUDRAFT_719894 [Laetiporus sulphureus 93-53]KZT11948.1 hypothetical protein LAESUDRAFT_719894 [Laetiporus sulphureus 93-53]